MQFEQVKELPEELAEFSKTVDEAVLRVTFKFLVSGGFRDDAAILQIKTLANEGFFKEFPPKQNN